MSIKMGNTGSSEAKMMDKVFLICFCIGVFLTESPLACEQLDVDLIFSSNSEHCEKIQMLFNGNDGEIYKENSYEFLSEGEFDWEENTDQRHKNTPWCIKSEEAMIDIDNDGVVDQVTRVSNCLGWNITQSLYIIGQEQADTDKYVIDFSGKKYPLKGLGEKVHEDGMFKGKKYFQSIYGNFLIEPFKIDDTFYIALGNPGFECGKTKLTAIVKLVKRNKVEDVCYLSQAAECKE